SWPRGSRVGRIHVLALGGNVCVGGSSTNFHLMAQKTIRKFVLDFNHRKTMGRPGRVKFKRMPNTLKRTGPTPIYANSASRELNLTWTIHQNILALASS